MRTSILVSWIFLLGSFCSRAADRDALIGDWVGGFDDHANYIFLQLRFKTNESAVTGSYDAPLLFQRNRPLQNTKIESSTVTFEMPNQPLPRFFTGQVKDGILSGKMTEGRTERSFEFARLAPIKPENYVGSYELEPGHFVFIRSAVELGIGALQFMDFKTGRLGVLFPTSDATFFTGPAVLVPFPREATVAFSLDNQTNASAITWSGGQKWNGRRIKLREESIRFTNGPITLSGAFVLPARPGPHPVVICAAGGTAAATREMFRHIAEFFALNGVASLVYDKRGLGSSTGDWMKVGFQDLAADALAGLHAIKNRPDVNPLRIGMFGASQSGWIVALAASQSSDVAFIISQSGPGVTPEEQELYRTESWLRTGGFSQDEITQAMNFVRQRYECSRTGKGWDALAQVQSSAKTNRWFAQVGGSVGKDNPFWTFWELIRAFDPVPVLEKVSCPTLAILGDKDTYLPAEKSAGIWREQLAKAGNKDATIRIFPNADHSLIESTTGGVNEAARARQFVPGFFELLRDWTLQHTR